jgi:predicted DNA-binding transcriptional regulator YafY
LDHIENHLAIQLAPTAAGDSSADVYGTIRRALATTHVVECQYESVSIDAEDKHGRSFEFRPYALLFNQRAWYALGFHDSHGEIRCLKLSRFSRTRILQKKYLIPADFSLDAYLGNAWRFIRGKERFLIDLWFDQQFAETISETQWHRTQKITWNDDASITFSCTVDGLDEIVWWILSMGPHCVVKKPKRLAHAVEDLARGIVARYSAASLKKNQPRKS